MKKHTSCARKAPATPNTRPRSGGSGHGRGNRSALTGFCCLFLLFSSSAHFAQVPHREPPVRPDLTPKNHREAARSYKNDPSLSRQFVASINLQNGTFRLCIHYKPGLDRQARYYADILQRYLPVVERELGRALRPPQGTFHLYGRGAVCGGYHDINAGINENSINSPALVLHEFGHLWSADEGLVSFFPVALHLAGKLRLNSEEYRRILSGWGFAGIQNKHDFPLGDYQQPRYKNYSEYSAMMYTKSFKLHYLLYKRLGWDKYLQLVRIRLSLPADYRNLPQALAQAAPGDWRAFLSGWVFPGPYGRFSLADFGDRGLDGLIDLDEHYLGTNADDPDSDGDGYADGWEKEHGKNPLDPDSKGDPRTPAVDGVEDPLAIKPVKVRMDPAGDGAGKSDISRMSVFLVGKRVLVRIHYHTREPVRIAHTFHLKDMRGMNYWIQTGDCRNVWISKFPYGRKFSEWEKSGIPPGRVSFARGTILEFLFDPADFKLGGDFSLNYMVGGIVQGKKEWNVDSVQSGVVYLGSPAVRIDGDLSDLLLIPGLTRLDDPAGDMKADAHYYDLKTLFAGTQSGTLYLGARFHNDVRAGKPQTATFHIRFPAEKHNYWVQFSGTTLVWFAHFKDGTAVKDWTTLNACPRVYGIRFDLDTGLEAGIPLAAFSEVKSFAGMEVMLHMGGDLKGKGNWAADTTRYLKVGTGK